MIAELFCYCQTEIAGSHSFIEELSLPLNLYSNSSSFSFWGGEEGDVNVDLLIVTLFLVLIFVVFEATLAANE